MWYEAPPIPAADLGVPSGLKPHSQRLAMCPPHARTAFELVALNRTLTWVSESTVERFTPPSLT